MKNIFFKKEEKACTLDTSDYMTNLAAPWANHWQDVSSSESKFSNTALTFFRILTFKYLCMLQS